MPAKSKSQRRLFALALEYKRGNLKKTEVSDEVIKLAELSEDKLKDYASTPENDLPDYIKESVGTMGGGFQYGHQFVDPKRREDMQLHFIKKDKAQADAEDNKKLEKTKPVGTLSTFNDWKTKAMSLQEFEAPMASTTNTPGVGNVSPPSNGNPGSGDSFGSLTKNHSDWKSWEKKRKKNQNHTKKKPDVQTQRPAWELGGRLPIPVVNTVK